MKRGSISLVLLVSLLVVTAGAAITATAINSRHHARDSYIRLQNRYLAESGVDLAIGLFVNYLASQDYVLTYQRTESGYLLMDQYAPYLTVEIAQSSETDNIKMQLVSTECSDYLSSIGFLDFSRDGGVSLFVAGYGQKEQLRLSHMGYESGFVLAQDSSPSVSRLRPVSLTVTSKYKSGEVLCTAEITGLKIKRGKLPSAESGQLASTNAAILTDEATIKYTNYQNYRRKKEV